MAQGTYCVHCDRRLFGPGPWHDETCDQYTEDIHITELY